MDKKVMIAVKQLPIIVEQLQQVKEEVAAKVDFALRLVCTEDTVKDVKRCGLNSTKNLQNTKRAEKRSKRQF